MSISSGTKLIILAGVAVLLPTVVLSVIQYRSLLQLQARTKAAAQDDLHRTARTIVARAEARMKTVASESLASLRAEDVDAADVGEIGRRFNAIRAAHPEIEQVFLFSLCSCRGEPFALLSRGTGAERIHCSRFDANQEVARALEAFRSSRPHPGSEPFLFSQASTAMLYVFRMLSGDRNRDATFAGFKLGSGYLSERLLPEITADLRSDGRAGIHLAPLAVSVIEDGRREIYSLGGGTQSYEARAPFGSMLPLWELAAGYQNTSIEALAREQFRSNLLLTLSVLGCLVLGIALTLRATVREAKLAEMKSNFVANVSHEMKTPLALIRLFAETLELGRVRSADKVRDYYCIIQSETQRLTRLIDNILDFAKMEAGRKEYQFAPACVGGVVEAVVRTYEYTIRTAGFDLRMEIQPGLPRISIDANALAQGVLNLLNNAVKYSDSEREITVRVDLREEHIAIEVADRGIGIPAEEHKRIFEKFHRVSGGLVHDTKGSGLGLTLTKHIVEAHGGRILVESAPGKGSHFTILLPAAASVVSSNKPEWSLGGEAVAQSADHRG